MMYTFLAWLSQILLMVLGLFLIIVVLLQRGRGGGLAGAFGGMGGQSAFGTKAGDIFTRITVVVAILWVLCAGLTGYVDRSPSTQNAASQASGLRQDTDEDEKDAKKSGTGAGDAKSETDKSGDDAAKAKPADEANKGAATPAEGESAAKPAEQSTPPAEKAEP